MWNVVVVSNGIENLRQAAKGKEDSLTSSKIVVARFICFEVLFQELDF